jgi:hypothetical protein
MSIRRWIAATVEIVAVACTAAWGQTFFGSVPGTVVDASSASRRCRTNRRDHRPVAPAADGQQFAGPGLEIVLCGVRMEFAIAAHPFVHFLPGIGGVVEFLRSCVHIS